MLEVMASCPITARQLERYSWKPQTQAMREGDRWLTIDEFDDLAICLRYFVQTNPRFQGRARSKGGPTTGITSSLIDAVQSRFGTHHERPEELYG
jgi:hypothetical protein